MSGSGSVSEAVGRVEAELAAAWGPPTGDEGGPAKARASTLNFVAVSTPAHLAEVQSAIDALAETRAGRCFLTTMDGRIDPWELQSDVASVCHTEGDQVVCYDRVGLTFGTMAASRAASVVSALALPEVCTIVEVAAGAPSSLVDALVKVCDRMVVDSAHTSIGRIAELARRTTSPVADRAFVRAFSWRELTARFFDEAVGATRGITKVSIARTSGGTHDPAALFLGWLAARLGWTFQSKTRAVDGAGNVVAIEATWEAPSADLGPDQLTKVAISTALDGAPLELSVARVEGKPGVVRWASAGAREAEHHYPLGFRDETWVLLKTLDVTSSDAVYRAAVERAAQWSAS